MVFFTRIYISHVQCRMESRSLHRFFVDLFILLLWGGARKTNFDGS